MSQDSAWKDVLEPLFPQFLEFFFPDIYQDVDFTKGFEFLDKELQQILKRSKSGKRIVDKLVKIFLKTAKKSGFCCILKFRAMRKKHLHAVFSAIIIASSTSLIAMSSVWSF